MDFHGKKDRKRKSLSKKQTVRKLLVILSVHTVTVKSDIISDVSSRRRIAKPQRRQSNLQKHSSHHNDVKIALNDRNSMYVHAPKSLKYHWGRVKI